MRTAALVCLITTVALAGAAEEPARDPNTPPQAVRPPVTVSAAAQAGVPPVLAAAPGAALDRAPQRAALERESTQPKPSTAADGLLVLGDFKALDVREGEAIVRLDGSERTLRPGMQLKGDLVRSISPRRMVLVRPGSTDPKKGETLIVVDFEDAGRSRVRIYAAQNWTATPPMKAE